MKKYRMIIAAALCVLMLSACAAQENRNIDTSDNSNISTSDNSNASTSKNSNARASENSNTSASDNSNTSASKNSNARASENSNASASDNNNTQEEEIKMKMNVQIGDYTFTATLEQNQAVNELVEMMEEGSVAIEMSDYAGFEKVGPLGKELTTDNHQTTTTEGDIVLYSGNQIVIFYGSNSWSYTRIGKIDDLTDWKKALGSGEVTAVLTVAE